MKTIIESWEALDITKVEAEVFRMQRRIFRASQNGNHEEMHHAQLHLCRSFYARFLAVYLAAEKSAGRKTAGVDGKKNLSPAQKLKLAQSLKITKRPDPVRRVNIPKPGSTETRSLGIPTLGDRALQHLIKLAVEPQWEARFPGGMYGFRKGRSCHDALIAIRLNIQRRPKWVLDGDIEKFFDRIDHGALIEKLDAPPPIHKAIHRILTAGMMEGEVFNPSDLGTPQGGPLSPLLANIALCGLEQDLVEAFPPRRVISGVRVAKEPKLILYADDFVVLHEAKPVIEEVQTFIGTWLSKFGLNLSPTKTRVIHTLDSVGGRRGFDFLGCEIRQHAVGRHQKKAYFNGVHTHIGPSQKAQKRIYSDCATIIEVTLRNKKRRAEIEHREKYGKLSPEGLLITRLNRKLRGWTGYFRHHNSKDAFSRLDHKLFRKLWRWVIRNHRSHTRTRLVAEFFNGGRPWSFRIKGRTPEEALTLMKADSVSIQRHYPVRSGASFFDGNWAYWGKRLGHYPGTPAWVTRLLKRQGGKCEHCHTEIRSDQRVLIQQHPIPSGQTVPRLVHEPCGLQNGHYPTRDAFTGEEVVGSPVP